MEHILPDSPHEALIADDMGLAKTHWALATILYLKYISIHPAVGRPLSFSYGKSVAQLEQVLRIFDADNEIYRRPSILIVPANLVTTLESAVESLFCGTRLNVFNLYWHRQLTHNELKYYSNYPEGGRTISLLSYSAYQARNNHPARLECCHWRVGIFDQSHMRKSRATQTVNSLMKIDAPCGIPLTETSMHYTVCDSVVLTQWVFAPITDKNELEKHGPGTLNSVIAEAKGGNNTLEEAYEQIEDIACPSWTIRPWGDMEDSKRDHLAHITELV